MLLLDCTSSTNKYRIDTFWQEKKSRSRYRSGTISFRPSSSNSSLVELTHLTAFHLVAPKDLPFFWNTKAQVQPRISAWEPLLACNAITSYDLSQVPGETRPSSSQDLCVSTLSFRHPYLGT